jgi:hypothetical protein
MAIDWHKAQPAPRGLWRLIHANFPQARSDGIYVCRNIAGTNKQSLHAEGRALDIHLRLTRPTEKYIGDHLFKAFVDLARSLGLQEVIWNRQVWSTTKPRVHTYTGQNPHTDHVHVGFTRAGSQGPGYNAMLLYRVGKIRTELEELGEAQGTQA